MARSISAILGLLLLLLASRNPVLARDWPVFRGDLHRSGVTDEQLDAERLRPAWVVRSKHRPRPAWDGPAKWDAYAGIQGLRNMRDYDRSFPVAVVGDAVFFGSSVDDSMHCLDARTGRERWTFTADAAIRVTPTVAQGRVYFGSDDGFAYCLNASDGKLLWKYRPPMSAPMILHRGRFISPWPCRSGVVVDNGTAYAAFSLLPWQPSWLCAVDAATGKVTGRGRFERRFDEMTMEGGIAVTADKLILTQGRVPPAVFQKVDGKPLGSLPNGGGSFLTIAGQLTFHGPGNKTGWVTVSELSSRKMLRALQGQISVVATPSRYLLRSDREIAALDRRTANPLWKTDFAMTFDHIVAGDTIIVGGRNEVVALSLRHGRRLWNGDVEGNALALAVANGRLFVSTDTGAIRCFAMGKGRISRPAVVALKPVHQRIERLAGIASVEHPGLIHRWVFQVEMNERARRRGIKDAERHVTDLVGGLPGTVIGTRRLQGVGGVEALVLDGKTTSVRITDDHTQAKLPNEKITAEAWVRVDQSLPWGGIIGAFQDNGNVEHGWLLGYVNRRFSFAVAAKNGPKRLTYLQAKSEFQPGVWYHVAGTYDGRVQRIFVNGRLENESKTQQGPIEYPPKAFFEIGAYHDRDEYFRMSGLLHDVRLYRASLNPELIQQHYRDEHTRLPQTVSLALGPYVAFHDPETAVVRWQTAEPSPSILRLTSGTSRRMFRDVQPKRSHAVTLRGLRPEHAYQYTIETHDKNGLGSTPPFDLETHFNYTLPSVAQRSDIPATVRHEVTAVIGSTPIRQGLCLVYGCDGRFLHELARQTQLQIVAIDTDAERIDAARNYLRQSGAYGVRVTVRRVENFNRLPFRGGCINLALMLPLLREGRPVGNAAEFFRQLRPAGGAALLGRAAGKRLVELNSWLNGLNKDAIRQAGDRWILQRKAVAGAGEWSHLYGRPDNAAFGGETLGGITSIDSLGVQWIGPPGPRAQADRNGRKPSPLAVNGRMFVQGLHRIAAIDVYNGSVLWSLEIPGLERFNMPRDCGNWCADANAIFAVVRDRCWQIDARTGKITKFHKTLPGPRKDWRYDWGFVARAGDKLLGSAEKQGAAYTDFWGKADAGWYDAIKGPVTEKVCSESLFALDAKTGETAWQYADGPIINATITATTNHVFFLESRHPTIRASQSRRLNTPELWNDLHLVCLNLETGSKEWEQPVTEVEGNVAVSMAHAEDRLVIVTSGNRRYDVYSHDAKTGRRQWRQQFDWPGNKDDHGKAISRPAIVGGRIFVRPRILDLATGRLQTAHIPAGGCGTYACTAHSLIYRNGSGGKMTVWDHTTGKSSNWSRLRPGCWLSTIPACGMLLSPEAGGGCSCGKWLESSLGFAPENWEPRRDRRK